MKTKAQFPRLNQPLFLCLWALAHALGWYAVYILNENSYFSGILPDWAMPVSFSVLLGAVLTFAQEAILRYSYQVPLQGWARLSLFGWLVGGFALYYMAENMPFWMTLGSLLLGMFTLPALTQWFVLRRYVRNAWIWVLASSVSSFVFGTVYMNISENYYNSDYTPFLFAGLAQACVTGLAMLWLFSGYTPEKPKHDLEPSDEWNDSAE